MNTNNQTLCNDIDWLIASIGRQPLSEFADKRKILQDKIMQIDADAARYRWLRKHCGLSTLFLLEHRREPNEWDAEVDAAMAKDGAE